jgi:hypothetical protein
MSNVGKGTAAWIGATAALASMWAGCGGSATGDEDSDSISKSAFIKKADSVCTRAGQQTGEEYAAFAKKNGLRPIEEPTSAQYAVVAKTIFIPSLRQQVKEIRALEVPAGDKARIDEFLKQVDNAIKTAEEKPVAAARSPDSLLANAHKTVKNYGFKVCGRPQ